MQQDVSPHHREILYKYPASNTCSSLCRNYHSTHMYCFNRQRCIKWVAGNRHMDLDRTPGGITTTGTGTSTTISGLSPGTYTYTVTNAAGCTSPSSGNIVINNPPAAPAAPSVGTITQPTCSVATGSVVLNGLPATGTWTLTRTPGGITTTGTGTSTTISGLAPGYVHLHGN